jgi:hypothetical protein
LIDWQKCLLCGHDFYVLVIWLNSYFFWFASVHFTERVKPKDI